MKTKVKSKRQHIAEPVITESSDEAEDEMLVDDTAEQPDSDANESVEGAEEVEAGPSGAADTDAKKKKKGIIYLSSIPKFMNVTILRELLSEYAAIGRIFLQPGKLSSESEPLCIDNSIFAAVCPNNW